MLQPAWYLITSADYWRSHSPVPPPPDLIALSRAMHEALSDEAGIGPSRTAVAVEALARGAEYVAFSTEFAAVTLPLRADAERFLLGVNLAISHLAQATARLAYQVSSSRAGDATGRLAHGNREALTHSLTAASHELADGAGQLKDAHAAVSPASGRPPLTAPYRLDELNG
jgi:hypothetical protein